MALSGVFYLVLLLALLGVYAATGLPVDMTNNLRGGQVLQVHCKDKHKDFGVHQIPADTVYTIQVEPTLFRRADYFCGFVFDNQLHWFDIYKDKRDGDECIGRCRYWGPNRGCTESKCTWFILDEGPCFVPRSGPNTCYPWNSVEPTWDSRFG